MINPSSAAALAAGLLLLLVAAALAGGPAFATDVGLINDLNEWRRNLVGVTLTAAVVTMLGGGFLLVPAALAGAAYLAWQKRLRAGMALLAVTLGGRLAIELAKLIIDRPRPVVGPYPVYVTSTSFPSGHAGNAMITYLALALFLAPVQRRPRVLLVALIASLVVGATRPLLGVHWPTDVVGGWAFGALWVLAAYVLARRARLIDE
jgi:membrane-associated phospholipid phosphatase